MRGGYSRGAPPAKGMSRASVSGTAGRRRPAGDLVLRGGAAERAGAVARPGRAIRAQARVRDAHQLVAVPGDAQVALAVVAPCGAGGQVLDHLETALAGLGGGHA